MFMLVVIIVIIVVMALTLIIVALVLMFVCCKFLVSFFSQLVELCTQSLLRLHYLEHLGSAQLIPVSGYDLSLCVELSYRLNDPVDLLCAHALLM